MSKQELSDVPRRAQARVAALQTQFRAVVVNGARQSGKTTVMLQMADGSGTYWSLDDQQVRSSALTDPTGFVMHAPGTLMRIDEVQRGGEALLLAIKSAVDLDRTPGQFLLAGSTRFLSDPSLRESLAGRAAIVNIWPFSQGEIGRVAEDFLETSILEPVSVRQRSPQPLTRDDYIDIICTGGFPEILHIGPQYRRTWFRSYIDAVVTRDIREMTRIRNSSAAGAVLAACGALTAQELVTTTISQRAQLPRETVDRYVNLLENTFLIHQLRPLSGNALNRAVKRSKVHVVDSGLAAYLQGQTVSSLRRKNASELGPLTETFMVNELAKQASWAEDDIDLYHYRDHDQAEVDLVAQHQSGASVGFEAKAALRVNEADFKHLKKLQTALGDQFSHGYVVYLGTQILPFGPRLSAIPLSTLWSPAPQ